MLAGFVPLLSITNCPVFVSKDVDKVNAGFIVKFVTWHLGLLCLETCHHSKYIVMGKNCFGMVPSLVTPTGSWFMNKNSSGWIEGACARLSSGGQAANVCRSRVRIGPGDSVVQRRDASVHVPRRVGV